MKAILKFDLDTDQDEYLAAINAMRYYSALVELSRQLRMAMKNDVPHAEHFHDLFWDTLNNEGVILHD